MKYHPIRKTNDTDIDLSHNRDYIGRHWNRKYIRAIQAILNSTKGKIGKGKTFFYKAFGNNIEEYMELLVMPETFILYRFFFEWLDNRIGYGTEHWRACWRECMDTLPNAEKQCLLTVIQSNEFDSTTANKFSSPKAKELISYYTKYRKDVTNPCSELYALKLEFDKLEDNTLKRGR